MKPENILPVQGCPVFHESSLNAKQTAFILWALNMKDPIMFTYTTVKADCLIGEGLFDDPFF